jgi:hypothetical protein
VGNKNINKVTITYKGFTPYSHQRAVINEIKDGLKTNKKVVVVSSRQKGKSFMIANLLLYYSINYKETKNFCLSPTLKQAKNIYDLIYNVLINSPERIITKANATDLEIVLRNNSKIKFCSAEQRDALRGYTVNGLLCIDECCYIPDDIFYTILPWCDAHKAPILMTSTPSVKDGFFWNYYNYGLEKINNTITIDWSDEIFREDIEKILPPEKLAEYEKVLPKNQFKSEYLGKWLDDEGQVFTNYKECVKTNKISITDKLYVGIDWANGVEGDDTVLSIINDKGQQVLLEYWNNLTPTQQVDAIYHVLAPVENQIVVIQPELNSIGTPYTDLLKDRLQISTQYKVKGFNTTNNSKSNLVSQLQVAFEQRHIEILEDDKQLRQLSVYSAEYNPKTKNVYYNAPQGLHDDIVMGLMLSYDAYLSRNNRGSYSLGGANMRKKDIRR